MLVGGDQSEIISGGLVSVYLVCAKVAVVIHASLCQFLWDSAEQTGHATRATGKWQMVSSGVDMFC